MNVHRHIALLAITGALTAAPGCMWVTTKHEGQALRKDVNALEAEVSGQRQDLSKKAEELQKVLDRATKVLTRSSADIGAEVDSLAADNAKLTGLVMDAKRRADAVVSASKEQQERLDSLEKRVAELEQKIASTPPKSPAELFAEAKALFDARSYEVAREKLKELVIRHSTSSIAPEAQYLRAETHYRQKEYKSAIGEFQKVFDKYPKSTRAPEALFRAGEAAEALKWCTHARAYYAVTVERYPKSSVAKKAKGKDRTLKRNMKNKRKCTE